MKKNDENKCTGCGVDLTGKKRYPVYSSRLAVIGYRCPVCHEKGKSPEVKKREEEMSKLIMNVPKLENVKPDPGKNPENVPGDTNIN